MLEVSLLTEDIVDARHHFVPFIVVPVSTSTVYQRSEFFFNTSELKFHWHKSRYLLFKSHIHHPCWHDLQRFAPKLVLPSLVCSQHVELKKEKWDSNSNIYYIKTSSHRPYNIPCQKLKLSDSAWHADIGGWWQTWGQTKPRNKQLLDSNLFDVWLDVIINYLFTNVAETSVLSDTLKCLSKNWIKRFVTVAKLSRGIARYGKSSNINLHKDKTEFASKYKEIHYCLNI